MYEDFKVIQKKKHKGYKNKQFETDKDAIRHKLIKKKDIKDNKSRRGRPILRPTWT